MSVTRIPIPEWAKTQQADDRLELSLAEIGLSVRTVNCLEDCGIFTVKDLLSCTPDRLLEIPNFGPKTLQAVYDALEKVGFHRHSRQSVKQQERQAAIQNGDHPLLRD